MCIDRIVSIFCASAWLMLGPLPGGAAYLEMPAGSYDAATAGKGAGRSGDEEVLGEGLPGDQSLPEAAAAAQ